MSLCLYANAGISVLNVTYSRAWAKHLKVSALFNRHNRNYIKYNYHGHFTEGKLSFSFDNFPKFIFSMWQSSLEPKILSMSELCDLESALFSRYLLS